jgi:hypothetical protein
MKVPQGFKIRKKVDCDTFINDCMCKNNVYSVIDKNTQIIIEKDKDGNISVSERFGDFTNPFNPSLEIAKTKGNCYDKTVQDYIWQFRKAINTQWFNEKKGW